MFRSQTSLIATVLFLAAPAATAQIPVDHGVMFHTRFVPPDVVDVFGSGTITTITGVTGAAIVSTSGFLDPVTGDLIVGACDISFADGKIHRIELNGLVGSSSLIANTGGAELAGLDHDWNGDFYACDDLTIYKVSRASGAVSTWDINAYGIGEFSALCIDQEANKMWVGTFDDGSIGSSGVIEYDLAAGPGPGTVVMDLQAAGFDGRITGMDDAFGILYVSTFEDTNGQSVIIVDPAASFAFLAPGAPLVMVNGVAFDRLRNIAHLVEGDGACGVSVGFSGAYMTLDISTTTVTSIAGLSPPDRSPHDVAVNDLLDRTEVFPQRPSASTDFTLEAAAHGNAGDIAGVAVVAINGVPVNPIVLGAAVCDSGGFASFAAPVLGSTLTPGDQYSVLSARIDAGGQLHLGNQVEVIVQP